MWIENDKNPTVIRWQHHSTISNLVSNLIDKIFDEHEAQIKAKDEEIEVSRAQRDGAIAVVQDHRAYTAKKCLEIKQRDEEIERLNCRVYHAESYINDLHNHPKDKKFYDAKARSIVAMLFWEWRKHKRMYELTKFGSYLAVTHLNNATLSKRIFQKAYKMLKDNK